MAATVLDSLKSTSAYPIPLRTILEVTERWGLRPDDEATQEVLRGASYNLALADLLLWLSLSPDISQGGQSFSFSDEQRLQLRTRSKQLQIRYMSEQEAEHHKPIYGYKGSIL